MTNCTFCYTNLWDLATLTPSSQQTNFPVSNTQHRWLSKTWRSATGSGTLTANIVADLGSSPQSVQAFFLKNHNFSPSATVKIQANTTNSWTSPPVDVTLTLAELIVYFWSTSKTYRYWRVYVEDTAPVTNYLEIGRIFLGPYFTPSVNLSIDYQKTFEDPSDLLLSDGGQLSTNQKTRYRTLQIQFQYLPPDDVTEFETMFLTCGLGKELFFTRDRDSGISTSMYCRISSTPTITHVFMEQYYNLSMSLEELR
jgi:hypothetical protein